MTLRLHQLEWQAAFIPMKYCVMVSDSATASSASQTARRFVTALVGAGHEIVMVFFYHDGVSIALKTATWPSDEINERQSWLDLAKENDLRLVVCPAAGQRRGVVRESDQDSLTDGFELAGLPHWINAVASCDRKIEFGSGHG